MEDGCGLQFLKVDYYEICFIYSRFILLVIHDETWCLLKLLEELLDVAKLPYNNGVITNDEITWVRKI